MRACGCAGETEVSPWYCSLATNLLGFAPPRLAICLPLPDAEFEAFAFEDGDDYTFEEFKEIAASFEEQWWGAEAVAKVLARVWKALVADAACQCPAQSALKAHPEPPSPLSFLPPPVLQLTYADREAEFWRIVEDGEDVVEVRVQHVCVRGGRVWLHSRSSQCLQQ